MPSVSTVSSFSAHTGLVMLESLLIDGISGRRGKEKLAEGHTPSVWWNRKLDSGSFIPATIFASILTASDYKMAKAWY